MNNNLDVYKYINDNRVNKGKDYVLLFVYANWCGVCKHAKPIFEDESNKHDNCSFVLLDEQTIPTFLGEQGIGAFPTFVLFSKNNSIYKIEDIKSGLNELKNFLSKIDNNKKNQHEYYVSNNEINAQSKKEFSTSNGFSLNLIINDNLKNLTKRLSENY